MVDSQPRDREARVHATMAQETDRAVRTADLLAPEATAVPREDREATREEPRQVAHQSSRTEDQTTTRTVREDVEVPREAMAAAEATLPLPLQATTTEQLRAL